MGFLKKFTKQEISWMMYDWANSAHSVIVVTILPIFFDTVAGYTADSVSSMSTWGFATSLAMAIVALSAPFLGVFGDIRGMRKKLFTVFMLLGVVSVAVFQQRKAEHQPPHRRQGEDKGKAGQHRHADRIHDQEDQQRDRGAADIAEAVPQR